MTAQMTDRELLERAARAAGIQGQYARVHQTYGDEWVDGIETGARTFWNPLRDDGDALRLAVKRGIGIIQHRGWGQVMHPTLGRIDFKHEQDATAATRRAIVGAATALEQPPVAASPL